MKIYILILSFVLIQNNIFSQKFDFKNMENNFINEHLNTTFPPIGKWNAMFNKNFDFNNIKSKTIIRIAETYCLPCVVEFPYFIELSKKYQDINFVYLMAEDESELNKLVNKYNIDSNYKNVFLINLKQDYILGYRINLGYPTNYFINSNGIVKHLKIGGNVKSKEKTFENFEKGINLISQ